MKCWIRGLAAAPDVLASDLIPSEKRPGSKSPRARDRAKLLLLDEVLTGLTPDRGADRCRMVRRVRETGVTVLMVEPCHGVVMPLVDRAIVLDLGQVLGRGQPKTSSAIRKSSLLILGTAHAVGA